MTRIGSLLGGVGRRRRVLVALLVGVVAGAAAATALAATRGGDGTGDRHSPTGIRRTAPAAARAPAAPPAALLPSPSSVAAQAGRADVDGSPGTPKVAAAPRALTGPPGALPSTSPVSCPAPTVTVGTTGQLAAALARAKPGTSIRMRDAVYAGTFTAATSGTAAKPIWLCGGPRAVIDGGGPKTGYGLHLAPGRWWRVVGFTVRDAQKGVVADGTRGSVIQGLTVLDIGDEGIHLRAFSTGTAVLRNTVRNTGLRRTKYGEGIYVGSAVSNWRSVSGGRPDASDNDVVDGNRISQTGAESVDVKEGTTGGVVSNNSFDGAGMTGADSWVDIKGSGWSVTGNSGRNTPRDGFQTHHILDGWGTGNVFRANVADVAPPGLGIHLAPPLANVVACSNHTASGTPMTSNVTCRP